MKLHLTVSPNANRNESARAQDGGLKVRVAAPATEGKANRELLSFLARELGIPPTSVRLLKGEGSRHKVVEIAGLSEDEVYRRLGGAG